MSHMEILFPDEVKESTSSSEIITVENGFVQRVTYSCGLVMEYHQSAEEVHVRTNWDFRELPDGRYVLVRPLDPGSTRR